MIIVMRGIPGSGKTTWAKTNFPNGHIVSADNFFERTGEYRWVKEEAAESHNWCLRTFIDLARLNRLDTIIVDNTNLYAIDIAPYIKVGAAYDHQHKIVNVLADELEAVTRNVHGVELPTMAKMQEAFREQVLPSFWVQETVGPFPSVVPSTT